MKNFKRFRRAYEALDAARKAVFSFSPQKVVEYFEDDFNATRRQASTNIDVATEAILEWFDEHFPKDTMDAAHSDQFTYPEFFDMLKCHPELVESNEDRLQSLLCSLKAKGLYGTGLEAVPTLDEFITEKMKLKKEYVPLAIKELESIENEAYKEDLVPILEMLKARRPYARRAYLMLYTVRDVVNDPEGRAHLVQARALLDKI